jgi:hypothetical protein
MGQLVEVLAVEAEEVPSELLLGASVDTPAAGRRLSAHAVEIGGWALGREETVEAIEVVHGERVLARAGVGQPRADIGAAFPGVAGAESTGFEVEIDSGGLPVESELAVRVGIGSATVPVARLRLRRYWRGRWEEEPPLVTIVLTGDAAEEDRAATMASLAAERYPLTELVVADPGAGESPAAARNEAIRRSEGELVLFLPAGAELAAGALANGVGRLAAAAAAAALIDGEAGGEVAAALYRRAAFEELEGFDGSAADCDRELAGPAGDLDALFEPGSLRRGEG